MTGKAKTNGRFVAGLAALAMGLCPSLPGYAEIYKYRENGVTVYTDEAPNRDYAVRMVRTRKGWVDPTKTPVAAVNMAENRRLYDEHVKRAAARYGLPLPLLHAVITAESAWNPDAVSSAGAAGLMQLMPATAARYGVGNRFSPADNIRGGSAYLRDLMGLFEGNLDLVLAAYNAGEGAVRRHGNAIPPFRETRRYVTRVREFHRRYSREMTDDTGRGAEANKHTGTVLGDNATP